MHKHLYWFYRINFESSFGIISERVGIIFLKANFEESILENSNKNLNKGILLAAQCAEVLAQGLRLLKNIDDQLYISNAGWGSASVGSHFRHILDFVESFLSGLEAGKINYNRRERDPQIEQNRNLAIRHLAILIEKLQHFPARFVGESVLISLESNPENPVEVEEYCRTSVLRELDFLRSHTIHHYALIAAKLSASGYEVESGFGVAPSTLDYWKKQNQAEKFAAK